MTASALYRLRSLLFVALLVMAAGSCREPDRQRDDSPGAPVHAAGQVVARVNGVPILAADLAFQLQGDADRQTALRSLIQAELLAQEAARRGLDQHPEVQRARRQAMAHALIRDKYGDTFTPADIPPEMVARAYEMNKVRFVHPEMVSVVHILAALQSSAPADQHQRARALAERVRKAAIDRAPSDGAAFEELAKQPPEGDSPVKLRAESLTTPLRGFTVSEFADAAFALSRPGDISPVVKTSYGYHVIYLKERLPAKNRLLPEVEREIRQRILEDARRELFVRWVDALQNQQRVVVNERALEQSLAPPSPES